MTIAPFDRLPVDPTSREFEGRARGVLEHLWDVRLLNRVVLLRSGVAKRFDLVSDDTQFVGDAKYYKNIPVPAAKFSTISEYVWLLQNVSGGGRRFLVFGRDREVPTRWLNRFGRLAEDIEFYFLDDVGRLIDLRAK